MKETTERYVKAMAEALESKKGQDIQVLKVSELDLAHRVFFVICTATSTTQVKALADEVEFRLKKDFEVAPHHIEGHDSASWILLDYGFALVHVFLESARNVRRDWKSSGRDAAPGRTTSLPCKSTRKCLQFCLMGDHIIGKI